MSYRDVIRIVEEMEKEDQVTNIENYLTSIRSEARAALKAVERDGNIVQAIELRADIRTMDRILDYVGRL